MPDDTDSPPVTWQSPPVQPGQSQVTSVVVPTPTLESVLRRHSQQNDALWKQLRQNTANMPLDQTEAAVAAAVRFQAQRQYQENLKAGMSQEEAMAIAAPLIYGGPKQGTLGQASAFINATKPRLNDVGGIGYSFDTKTGQWTARTPAKATPPPRPMNVGGMLYDVTDPRNPKPMTPAPPHQDPLDLAEYHGLIAQMGQVQKESADDEIGSPEFNNHQTQLRVLGQQLHAIRQRSNRSVPGPVAPPTTGTTNAPAIAPRRVAAPGNNLVRVTGPNNKRGWVPAGTSLPPGWSLAQ